MYMLHSGGPQHEKDGNTNEPRQIWKPNTAKTIPRTQTQNKEVISYN